MPWESFVEGAETYHTNWFIYIYIPYLYIQYRHISIYIVFEYAVNNVYIYFENFNSIYIYTCICILIYILGICNTCFHNV